MKKIIAVATLVAIIGAPVSTPAMASSLNISTTFEDRCDGAQNVESFRIRYMNELGSDARRAQKLATLTQGKIQCVQDAVAGNRGVVRELNRRGIAVHNVIDVETLAGTSIVYVR